MQIIKAVLAIIVLLIIIGVSVFAYFGGFHKVSVALRDAGGESVIFQEVRGDYSQSPNVIEKIRNALTEDNKAETCLGFGTYYDDPRKVERKDLRSEVGCIIDKKHLASVEGLKAKYRINTLARKKYIVTEFPYRNQMSILVAIVRVYPALAEYANNNGYNDDIAVMEIYDFSNKRVIYRMEARRKP